MVLFVLGSLLITIGVIGVLLSVLWKSDNSLNPIFGIVVGLLGILLVVGSTFRTVPGHSVGIPVTFGKVGQEMESGPHFTKPWTKVVVFSAQTQKFSLTDEENKRNAIEVRASDLYDLRVGVQLGYSINITSTPDLYKEFRSMDGIRDRLVAIQVDKAVKGVFSQYPAEESFATKQVEVRTKFEDTLRAALAERGITVKEVTIAVTPSEAAAQAIRTRAALKEAAEQAKIDQQKKTTEAETRTKEAEEKKKADIAAAEGAAEAVKIAAEAKAESNQLIAASITPALIEYMRAQALSTANTIYVPADASLLIGTAP